MKYLKFRKIGSILLISLFFIIYISCKDNSSDYSLNTNNFQQAEYVPDQKIEIISGAERMAKYIPKVQGKKIALVVNHTSKVGDKHLLDSILQMEIDVQRVFAPEHGFRGDADAGTHLKDGVDEKTKVQITSLYGSKKKPSPQDLEGIETVIFDIQDVGVRFYTYISTMHYVMEACAENGIPMIVLDRPNPNGYYVDGPVLDLKYQSFVGMHPIPVVYGLTIGELAVMINEEGWLANGLKCDLTVIACLGYTHDKSEPLSIKPSPNLPNLQSILLYPSLCFFEPTIVSVGRGTDDQFQVIGHPDYQPGSYKFTPVPKPGAMKPKLEGIECVGKSFKNLAIGDIKSQGKLDLSDLLEYHVYFDTDKFFTNISFFDKLAGTDELRNQIILGKSEEEIRSSWEPALSQYKSLRKKYLMYD